ncbi:MAG: hypothetical protein ACLQJ7_07540 [Syntrophobacteraceae bacterium]
MANKLIFVSCGQLTDTEKTLGVLIKTVIDGTPGFEAYFAETVHDFEALGRHVLDGICRCAGAVVVLQDRGIVTHPDGTEWGHRSSVWVNQEVAILAYRQFFEAKKIPILAFAEPNVRLEGAMTALIVNPGSTGTPQDMVSAVKTWLAEEHFISRMSDELFAEKWNSLTEDVRKVVYGLLQEGGYNVKESSVRQAVIRLFGMDRELVNNAVRRALGQFTATDLVKVIPSGYSGKELSVHPTWEFQLKRQIDSWFSEQNKSSKPT